MGSLHQQGAGGELVLEQNDGTRRLYWSGGDLKYLRSDAVGEQFGNFLIRRGVLDMAALNELLADGEGARVGDRVVQWGLMTVEERDARLHELLASILLHALEHPILKPTWLPGPLYGNLSGDLQFRLDHRRLVWDVFQSAQIDRELLEMFRSEPDWRWQAPPDLLLSLSDLPLNPKIAYAMTLMGTEPLACDTLTSLMGLDAPDAARLVAALWTLGGLSLIRGALPLLPKPEPPPVPEPEPIQIVAEDLEPLSPPAPAPPLELEAMPYDGEPLELVMPPDPPVAPAAKAPPVPEPAPEPGEESAADRARRLFIKAKSYLMQDRTSEAIRALEQSIKLDGDSMESYDTWLLLGRLRLANPAWSTRAIEALQVASRLKPKAAEPWALMGELYHRKGFTANAQGCFRRALELDPSVAVPADWEVESAPPSPGVKEHRGGLMSRLKGMLSRDSG
jgi:tetratricopeptide (TPR) repeat protein